MACMLWRKWKTTIGTTIIICCWGTKDYFLQENLLWDYTFSVKVTRKFTKDWGSPTKNKKQIKSWWTIFIKILKENLRHGSISSIGDAS